MAIKMLIFDYRDSEKNFFENNKNDDFDITFFYESLNDETVNNLSEEELNDTSIISVFINSEVTEEVINKFKNLRLISTRSTGIDHINKNAAEAKNIAIVNVEAYGSGSVAQYTICLIIALVRHLIPASKHLESKVSCANYVGRDVSKLTLGVVGTGSIGIAVCKIALALGMKVLAYDKIEKQELINTTEIKYTDLNTLLKESDVVTLHLPYTGENKNMFAKDQFKIMKNTAYFINTSRGEIVNLRDLYEAIKNNTIQCAALDVVTCEYETFRCSQLSQDTGIPFECIEEAKIAVEMSTHPNIIITPHIAYETQDAINYILEQTFIGILDTIKGGTQYRAY